MQMCFFRDPTAPPSFEYFLVRSLSWGFMAPILCSSKPSIPEAGLLQRQGMSSLHPVVVTPQGRCVFRTQKFRVNL